MKLEQAKAIGGKLAESLRPYCLRIELAGSTRRKKPEPRDLEIVCIPRMILSGLFGDENLRDPGFAQTVNKWEKVKGDPATGKYTQRIIKIHSSGGTEEIKLDLFMTTAYSWGLIFAIRTGSARFSHQVLARRWVQLGYKSHEGILRKGNEDIPVREEKDLFDLLGFSFTEPECRE